jgi:hypothetical protein
MDNNNLQQARDHSFGEVSLAQGVQQCVNYKQCFSECVFCVQFIRQTSWQDQLPVYYSTALAVGPETAASVPHTPKAGNASSPR